MKGTRVKNIRNNINCLGYIKSMDILILHMNWCLYKVVLIKRCAHVEQISLCLMSMFSNTLIMGTHYQFHSTRAQRVPSYRLIYTPWKDWSRLGKIGKLFDYWSSGQVTGCSPPYQTCKLMQFNIINVVDYIYCNLNYNEARGVFMGEGQRGAPLIDQLIYI